MEFQNMDNKMANVNTTNVRALKKNLFVHYDFSPKGMKKYLSFDKILIIR